MKIMLLYEPSADRNIPFAAGVERYRRFAEELGRYARTTIRVVEEYLKNTFEDGYILFAGSGDLARSLAECGPERAKQLPPRIVLLDVSWQRALEQLELFRLAGAVDSLRMSEWLGHPSSCTGPFGLRYLTRALGATCVQLPWLQSKHYCLLESNRHRGMPDLVADYLIAYDRDRKPLNTLPSLTVGRFVQTHNKHATDTSPTSFTIGQHLTPISLVESVSIKRAIASLKPARERAGISPLQIAESTGLDLDQISLLEQGDLVRTSLGTLSGYVIAMESTLGWTLPGLRESSAALQQKVTVDVEDLPERPVFNPLQMMVQGGLTVMSQRRIRGERRDRESEVFIHLAQMERTHAGI